MKSTLQKFKKLPLKEMIEASKLNELKRKVTDIFKEKGQEKEDVVMTNIENAQSRLITKMSNTERSARLNRIAANYRRRTLDHPAYAGTKKDQPRRSRATSYRARRG